ncbi:hypothetical protein HMPREF0973_01158 [Prevotella veroralis F0319]|uniref:Uncharacterized protein n=1 Tax=Prevotella veroralis F0319 TaxID=649761 RepID=C9MNH1_9BACT|nr:hypothetical protein HMPREF0973_01158 [Prevotella veroralis F0319]
MFWRTDEGVCPYFVISYPTELTLLSFSREAFFNARRAFLQHEETPFLI